MALVVNRTAARRHSTAQNARSIRDAGSDPDVRSIPTAPAAALPVQRRGGTPTVPDQAVPDQTAELHGASAQVPADPAPAAGRLPSRRRGARPPSGRAARPPSVPVLAADATATMLAAVLAAALWTQAGTGLAGGRGALLAALTGLVWLGSLGFVGCYAPPLRRAPRETVREVATAALVLLCAAGLAGLVLGVALPRADVLAGVLAVSGLTLVGRGVVVWVARRGGPERRTRIAVVGEQDDVVRRFVEGLHGAQGGCYDLTAVCLLGGGSADWCGVPVHRDPDGLAEAVQPLGVEAVVVLPSHELGPERIRRLAWRLERHGTHLFVVPPLPEISVRRVALSQVGGTVAVQVHHAELQGLRRLAKDVFDRVVAAAALAVVLPLLAALMLAVRLDSPGPSLFRQERVGKDGRRFTMLKLRTMSVDAEARRAELLAHNELDGVLFKIRHDPRVTRVGALLRRYSLDELPQLVNVLRGHMSLVGPRPPLPSEVAAYEEPVHRRLAVKPGITGLWQVSGRSDLSWAESVRLDLRYVEDWSLGLDAAILWRTGRAVLAQDGAY